MKTPYTLNIDGVGNHPGLEVVLPDRPTGAQMDTLRDTLSPLMRCPFSERPRILAEETTVEEFLLLLPAEVNRVLRACSR
jgi:hypothetical protein